VCKLRRIPAESPRTTGTTVKATKRKKRHYVIFSAKPMVLWELQINGTPLYGLGEISLPMVFNF
jgi:hypothetical protein